jgi:hypothetical protein
VSFVDSERPIIWINDAYCDGKPFVVYADPRPTGFVNSTLSQLAEAKGDFRVFTNVVKYLLTLLPKWELFQYGNKKRLSALLS